MLPPDPPPADAGADRTAADRAYASPSGGAGCVAVGTLGVSILIAGWAVAAIPVAAAMGQSYPAVLIAPLLFLLWTATVAALLFVGLLGGAGAAFCAWGAVAAGNRFRGGAFALLAVLHGGAWQVGVWSAGGSEGTERLVYGGLSAAPAVSGVATLFWIARGGGLGANEAGCGDADFPGGPR